MLFLAPYRRTLTNATVLRARKQNASGFAPAAPAFPDSPLYNPSRAGSTPANRDQLEASYTGNVDAEYRGDSKGKGKAYDDDFLALDMGGSNGGNLNGTGGGQTANGGQQYMQMQLMENQQVGARAGHVAALIYSC